MVIMNPLVNTEFVFSLGALLLGMGMFNCRRIRDALSHIKQCMVTWPIRDSIIVLVLTVLGSAWAISFI